MSEHIVDVGKRHIKEINEEIQEAAAAGKVIRVINTLSRHNLGVGLPDGCQISFEGSTGYYCGGLNVGATIDIERNAGWACGEGMSKGHITVGGYAGMSCGAAMMGGTIHVKGDAGPRVGVAMKGGNIVVEGKIGYQSGFMSHAGKIMLMLMLLSQPPKKLQRWTPFWTHWVWWTHRGSGANWCLASAFGILKAGTQAHGS